MMMTLVAMLTIAATGKAMSYEQARNEALFLTDKMAYELNLTDEQYEAAYEINLDYLMGVTSYDDVYSTYWERRNLLLPPTVLGRRLLALRHLCTLSPPRLLLLRTSGVLCQLSWRSRLARSWRSRLLLRPSRPLPSRRTQPFRHVRPLEPW